MNIYVGNLSRDVSEEDLRKAFEAFGQITSASVIKDKFTGEARGFGFVEMADKAQAQAAIDGLNGKDLKGRALSVNEARPRTENRGGGGGRSSGGGGWGNRDGGRRDGGGGGRRDGGRRF
jgi:RNA recognition motif-containing protein